MIVTVFYHSVQISNVRSVLFIGKICVEFFFRQALYQFCKFLRIFPKIIKEILPLLLRFYRRKIETKLISYFQIAAKQNVFNPFDIIMNMLCKNRNGIKILNLCSSHFII